MTKQVLPGRWSRSQDVESKLWRNAAALSHNIERQGPFVTMSVLVRYVYHRGSI
jgi:hypothetical protein